MNIVVSMIARFAARCQTPRESVDKPAQGWRRASMPAMTGRYRRCVQ